MAAVKAAVYAADAAVESAVGQETGRLAEHIQWEPRRVLRGVHVVALACGMDHTVAVAGPSLQCQPYPRFGKPRTSAKAEARLVL